MSFPEYTKQNFIFSISSSDLISASTFNGKVNRLIEEANTEKKKKHAPIKKNPEITS